MIWMGSFCSSAWWDHIKIGSIFGIKIDFKINAVYRMSEKMHYQFVKIVFPFFIDELDRVVAIWRVTVSYNTLFQKMPCELSNMKLGRNIYAAKGLFLLRKWNQRFIVRINFFPSVSFKAVLVYHNLSGLEMFSRIKEMLKEELRIAKNV